MKQLLQDLKKGEILLEEIPLPSCGANEVLIKTDEALYQSKHEGRNRITM